MSLRLFLYFPFILFALGLLSACSADPMVSAVCEKSAQKGYVLKWEIYPDKDDLSVEIFDSDCDTIFPSAPAFTAKSNDYMAMVDDSVTTTGRRFFKLKVGRTSSGIISNRFFDFDSVQNFRDLGGYMGNNKKQIRWGKIYRSGGFENMTPLDRSKIDQLGIKTVIDIRSSDTRNKYENHVQSACYIRIPISEYGYGYLKDRIMEDQFTRADAITYNQRRHKEMIEENTKDFALFFDYLCDENSYPIAFHSHLGKDQVALATYFLLRALNVPSEIIEEDFMQSNVGINKINLMKDASKLTESGQETLTALVMTDISFLRYSISCMRSKSGSVDEYMTKELRLTPDKRKKLQDILLYN